MSAGGILSLDEEEPLSQLKKQILNMPPAKSEARGRWLRPRGQGEGGPDHKDQRQGSSWWEVLGGPGGGGSEMAGFAKGREAWLSTLFHAVNTQNCVYPLPALPSVDTATVSLCSGNAMLTEHCLISIHSWVFWLP